MLQLQQGNFFGLHNQVLHLNNLIITDTEYTHDRVDWHCHQNPYFTFMLQGRMLEGNKKGSYECGPGTLLFHQWDDMHYNIKHPGYTRGFHIELKSDFFVQQQICTNDIQGSLKLDNPLIKTLFRQIHAETKTNDNIQSIALHELIMNVLGSITKYEKYNNELAPSWVGKIREVLHALPPEELSWLFLAEVANIHPMHLSRDFPKYFHTSVGNYLRKIRLEQVMNLLNSSNMSITDIAYQCGFADQSHCIRYFKSMMGITPLQYQKKILAR